MTATSESAFSPIIRGFVKEFNSRVSPKVHSPSKWVRMTPPDSSDFDALKLDPGFLPFTRVGSLGEVWDVCNGYVTVRVGTESVMYHQSVFLETFVRAVDGKEWGSYLRE